MEQEGKIEPGPQAFRRRAQRFRGAAGEHGQVVDVRKAKLVHEVQQFKVAVCDFEAISCRHGRVTLPRIRWVRRFYHRRRKRESHDKASGGPFRGLPNGVNSRCIRTRR
jgi:hypothetical protein